MTELETCPSCGALPADQVLDPKDVEALLSQARNALNFILAFYVPGQRHLDTNAWKQAEAGGWKALNSLNEQLGINDPEAQQMARETAQKAGWK